MININNAIDFNEYPFNYPKEGAKREMGIGDHLTVVGAIGRLVEQKGWLTYLYAAKETLKHFPKMLFLIVGDGVMLNDLKKVIKELDIEDNIVITGYSCDINKVYSAIDIFVNTSLWEGLPYVLLEAMWFKKPIVATNLGYQNIIYENETGFLVDVKDYITLSKKIRELINDKAKGIKMGEKGRSLVESNFSFEEFVKKHERLYCTCTIKSETH